MNDKLKGGHPYADYCLRTSLYCSVMSVWTGTISGQKFVEAMMEECRLNKFFGHRKSSEYRWSNSDGLTKWLHDKLLRLIHLDPYKGLNGDQYRAYFMWLYINRNRSKAFKILLGFILRLGFYPSLMENVLLRPQNIILLLATIWGPLKYIVMPFFLLSKWRNLRVPISESTTNKIVLLPTMHLLGFDLPDMPFIIDTYDTYFKPGTDGHFIGKACKNALIYGT